MRRFDISRRSGIKIGGTAKNAAREARRLSFDSRNLGEKKVWALVPILLRMAADGGKCLGGNIMFHPAGIGKCGVLRYAKPHEKLR